jgi:hypothetical protein
MLRDCVYNRTVTRIQPRDKTATPAKASAIVLEKLSYLCFRTVPHRHSQSRLYRDNRSPRYSSIANIWTWHDSYSAYRTPASDTLRILLVRPSTLTQQLGNCRDVIHTPRRDSMMRQPQHLKSTTALIRLNAFASPRHTARNNIQETLERSTIRPFKRQALQKEHHQWILVKLFSVLQELT